MKNIQIIKKRWDLLFWRFLTEMRKFENWWKKMKKMRNKNHLRRGNILNYNRCNRLNILSSLVIEILPLPPTGKSNKSYDPHPGSSRLYRLGVSQAQKSKGVGRWAPAATHFIEFAPNFLFLFPITATLKHANGSVGWSRHWPCQKPNWFHDRNHAVKNDNLAGLITNIIVTAIRRCWRASAHLGVTHHGGKP